jgi:hypothetical protein
MQYVIGACFCIRLKVYSERQKYSTQIYLLKNGNQLKFITTQHK